MRAMAEHTQSGELFVVELEAVWDGDNCTGSRIALATGPVNRRDLGIEGSMEPSAELFDRLDNWQDLTDEDAEWLQAEEDAGRIIYPIGAR